MRVSPSTVVRSNPPPAIDVRMLIGIERMIPSMISATARFHHEDAVRPNAVTGPPVAR